MAQVTVTTGYFSDLAVTGCPEFYCGGIVVEQFGCLGGHKSSGPPSAAGTCWTAAAMNVPTSPTIRIEILNARFMCSSPKEPRRVEFLGTLSRKRIIGHVSTSMCNSFHSALPPTWA